MAQMTEPTIEIDGTTYTMHLGRIERTMLGWEDHGIFTYMLSLDYGGSGQGAGTMCMDEPGDPVLDENGKETYKRGPRKGTAYGHDLIMRTMEVVGVSLWEDLKGCRVYALKTGGWGGMIEGLANVEHPTSTYLIFKEHAARFKD